MKALDIIDEHMIIRETVGYDFLKNIEVSDLPAVIDFLKIVYNYNRMTQILKEKECSNPSQKS
jgi:hypothetical protein